MGSIFPRGPWLWGTLQPPLQCPRSRGVSQPELLGQRIHALAQLCPLV